MFKYFLFYIKMHIGKSHYKKMLITYSLFTLALITILSLTMINFYNKSLSEEISKSDKRLLEQVKISSDILIDDNVRSLIMDKFLDVSRDANILNFFYANSSNETETIYLLYNSLSNILLDNSFIDSIYIYRKCDDTLISSREGVNFSVSDKSNSDNNYVNIRAVQKIMSSDQNQYWISPLENQSYWKNKRIISFAQSIPYFKNTAKIGCVIINLNEEMFFKAINNTSDDSTGQLVVMDSQKRVFTNSNPLELFSNADTMAYPEEVFHKDQGFTTCDTAGKTYGISWIKSSVTDWRYLSITPISTLNNELFLAKQFAIMIMVLAILLSLVFIRFITTFLYKPIKTFFKTLAGKLPNHDMDNTDEISAIGRLITNLSDKVGEMDELLQQNKGLIKHKLVSDLMYGNTAGSLNDINERLKILHESFDHPYFTVVIVELDSCGLGMLGPKQHEYVIYKVINTVDSVLSLGCICISASMQNNRIVAVVNYENHENFQSKLVFLSDTLHFDPGISCNIALSRTAGDIQALGGLYEQAADYLNYGFIHNYGNIFTPEWINQTAKSSNATDNAATEKLQPLLRLHKASAVKEELHKLQEYIKNEKCNYNDVRNLTQQMTGMFCQVIRDQKISDESLEKDAVLAEYNSLRSLDEFISWFSKLTDLYMEKVHLRDSFINEEFINKIMSYISENADNLITLNSIANKFSISPNYLSKVFKEKSGSNISDFIIDSKLQTACRLLVSEPDKNIQDIGIQLGYFNTPYFISIFKKKYGMTPSKFRKNSYAS